MIYKKPEKQNANFKVVPSHPHLLISMFPPASPKVEPVQKPTLNTGLAGIHLLSGEGD